MKRKGWHGQSYRHSLAAKGIPTGRSKIYYKGKVKKMAEFLADDGRAKTPDFSEELKLREAERVREEAFQILRTAEEKGDINFKQSQQFFERDFRDEVKDFLDDKRTAEQFRANINIKLKRVTEKVKIMGVSDSTDDHNFFDGIEERKEFKTR